MPIFSLGIVTARDDLSISWAREAAWKTVQEFAAMKPEDARRHYELGPDARDWKVALAQADLRGSGMDSEKLCRVLYRPFDWRWTYYTGHSRGFHCMPRGEVMGHVIAIRHNLSICVTRQTRDQWDVLASRFISAHKSVAAYDATSAFPLWLAPQDGEFVTETRPNVSPTVLRHFGKDTTPEDILHYVYAVFHSPGYRSRYAEFLKIDFPRFPLTDNLDLFRDLAHVGDRLVALHVLESPKLDHFFTTYTGPKNPEVGRVGWSDHTVWLDAVATKKGQAAKPGTIGFRGVPEDVWNFHIGGYQVCEKWLKDRKGRTLSKDDIAHYQKIVVALAETIRLMKEIDEVIEQHGGWPGAFQTDEAKAAIAKVIPFRPRTVEPKPEECYVTCVPFVPLKAAAGAFGDPQHIEDEGFEWVAVESRHRLRPGMFVAQVVGKSMEPAISDGAWCLFRAPVEGTRQGKTVLVQLRGATDPETGQRYTVKRYESEKTAKGDSWRHARITLKPLNPDFEPIVLTGKDQGELQVIAELIEVLGGES